MYNLAYGLVVRHHHSPRHSFADVVREYLVSYGVSEEPLVCKPFNHPLPHLLVDVRLVAVDAVRGDVVQCF